MKHLFFQLLGVLFMAVVLGPSLRSAAVQNAAAGLKIVVIEGENAVNVVQQKTAVAPVVEVRDRNNQPVAGAVVRFAIQGGRATLGSARTLSVTTNAAGRAVAAGLTPTGSGAIQISATATFQGQTAAAVTIAQTNVMTAAQAATATSVSGAGGATGAGAGGTAAGASGAAAGAGGAAAGAGSAAGAATGAGAAAGGAGLSVTTIGVIGGAAVGGTLAAKQVTGGGDDGDTDDNTETRFQSQYTGNLQFTFSGVGGCARTHATTGTMRLHLVVAADGNVSGTADLSQTDVVTMSTCGAAGPQLGDTNPFSTQGIPVQGNGTQLNFHYAGSNTFPPLNGAPGGTRTDDMVFTGTLTNGQVFGSIAHNVSVGPPLTPSGVGSYAVAP